MRRAFKIAIASVLARTISLSTCEIVSDRDSVSFNELFYKTRVSDQDNDRINMIYIYMHRQA